jgi:hypothetical protein
MKLMGNLGNPFGTSMTAFRHHLRLTWVVLAAIVGMLSAAGGASASTSYPESRGPGRSCCVRRVCAKCCCPPASDVSGRPLVGRSATVAPGGSRLSTPAPLCECRPGRPKLPASSTDPRFSEHRQEQVADHAVELIVESLPAISPVRIVLSSALPPKSPLYLRNSRLLI